MELFLSTPAADDDTWDQGAARERITLLQKLEAVLRPLITSGSRNESRLWLCDTVSSIRTITIQGQRQAFLELLRCEPGKREVAAQILRLIFQKRPERAGAVLAKRCGMLESFFEGNSQRILQWFDHFASTSESGHRKGARAISHFAFVNRDICWEDLEWRGKHGQSPAVVATKPHYFHDLDVLRTVENFLEHVPEFWSSEELADSMKDGNILQIDIQFFVDKFVHLMYEEGSEDIWTIIKDFLSEEKFSFLAQHVLILLSDCDLQSFLKSLHKVVNKTLRFDFEHSSSWLEILLALYDDDVPLDELLLQNAVITQSRKLLRLLSDEEHEEECQEIEEILQSDTAPMVAAAHWSLLKECCNIKLELAMKWIGLQIWVLHYRIYKECKTKESYESLFSKNMIHFKRSGNFSLLPSDEYSDLLGSDDNKKRRFMSKKRRKKYVSNNRNDEELLDFETLDRHKEFDLVGGSWLLSTDDYSCSWNMVDLPEHLSRHCFKVWMKWVHSQT